MRNVLKILALLAALALAAEVFLQAASIVVYFKEKRPENLPDANGVKSIVCLGDSFTHGMGSSDASMTYPAQLQQALDQAAPGKWRVFPAAWPGRNSRDALEALIPVLEKYEPKLVYVMIGLNDSWTQPERLSLGEVVTSPEVVSKGYTFRWRLPRLMAWLTRARVAKGQAERSSLDNPLAFNKLRTRIEQGEQEQVLRELEAAEVALAAEAAPKRNDVEALVSAWSMSGSLERSVQLARKYLELFSDSPSLWFQVSQYHYMKGEWNPAREAINRALECVSHEIDNPNLIASMHSARGDLYIRDDLDEGIASYLRAYQLNKDPVFFHGKAEQYWLAPEHIEAIAKTLGIVPPSEVPARVGEPGSPDTRYFENYTYHIGQMTEACRKRGAELVMVSYPFNAYPQSFQELMEQTASALECGFVNVAAPIDAVLEHRDRTELFVPDGHCTDEGYRIVAETIAQDVLERGKVLAL